MKIVNLVVNLWQTEKASIQFKYYRGKIKQEKNRYVVSAGKAMMSWTIFLLLQPKWKLQTTFREF
jgi:hypothetical protein